MKPEKLGDGRTTSITELCSHFHRALWSGGKGDNICFLYIPDHVCILWKYQSTQILSGCQVLPVKLNDFFRRGMGGKGKCTMNFNAKAPTLLLLIYPLWFLISRTVPSRNDGKIEWGVFFGGGYISGFPCTAEEWKDLLENRLLFSFFCLQLWWSFDQVQSFSFKFYLCGVKAQATLLLLSLPLPYISCHF